jgi:hypothetical protein
MQIVNNTFLNNETAFFGIRTTGSSEFTGNLFSGTPNIFGLGYYFGTTVVTGNSFRDASFVVEAPAIGFGYGTINFSGNWWGSIDTNLIDHLIFDIYDDATLNEVTYLPILDEEPGNIGSLLPDDISLPLPPAPL